MWTPPSYDRGEHHDTSRVVGRRQHDAFEDDADDPYKLKSRFVRTHKADFQLALQEIRAGRKQSCWSWYIFPVGPWVVGGHEQGSSTNQYYALRDLPPNQLRGDDAACAFLTLPVTATVNLRSNYIDMMSAVGDKLEAGRSPVKLVGVLDEPKLRSSVKLFERISRHGFDEEVNAVCRRVLTALREAPEE
eukprot:NODE_16467_length_993_cov_3.356813.p1 GENE.NODE_16467_length_993_cov_3.356813~~NODE_16467_length_993_cov_3.356813.p1  ORF type:complete len:190 (-),score=54.71 NODE_16467_length_993_cov_3.356813:341-910(-)